MEKLRPKDKRATALRPRDRLVGWLTFIHVVSPPWVWLSWLLDEAGHVVNPYLARTPGRTWILVVAKAWGLDRS